MTCPGCGADTDAATVTCFTCGRTVVPSIRQGSVLAGRYEMVSVLGRGGMGTVYRAHDRMLDEAVALKVLKPEVAEGAGFAARFRSELKLARRVTHRNVCRVHDYGEWEQICYFTMEYVQGTNLKELIRAKGGLEAVVVLDLAIQITKGLQAIHDAGIVHRDLKTSNIMLDPRGVVRLMDFGIAKYEGTAGTTGIVLGTPEYMSPEQARGDRLDIRTDVYAAGIVVFEALTARVPFTGSPMAILRQQVHDLAALTASDIPDVLVPVLGKALAKNPADRYESARSLGEALREARSILAPGAPPATISTDARPVLPAAPAAGRSPESIPSLIAALRDADVAVRRASAATLGDMGAIARTAVPALLGVMLEDVDPAASAAAAHALKQIVGGAEHAPTPVPSPTRARPSLFALVEQLASADAAARWRAVLALGEMGAEAGDAVPALLPLLHDADAVVRASAIRTMARMGVVTLDVVSHLTALLKDDDPLVAEEAGRALDELSDRPSDATRAAG